MDQGYLENIRTASHGDQMARSLIRDVPRLFFWKRARIGPGQHRMNFIARSTSNQNELESLIMKTERPDVADSPGHRLEDPQSGLDSTHLMKSLAYFLVKDMRPTEILSGVGFRTLLKLSPGKGEQEHMRREYLPLLHKEVQQKILARMKEAPKFSLYPSLLLEFWTSASCVEFLSIGVRANNLEFLWKTVVVDSTENVAQHLLQVNSELGLGEHVYLTTNDPKRLQAIVDECLKEGPGKFLVTPCVSSAFKRALDMGVQNCRELQTLFSGLSSITKSDGNRRASQLSESSGTGSLESDQGCPMMDQTTEAINFTQACEIAKNVSLLSEKDRQAGEPYFIFLTELKAIQRRLGFGSEKSAIKAANSVLEQLISSNAPCCDELKQTVFGAFVKEIESVPVLSQALSVSKFFHLKTQRGELPKSGFDESSFYAMLAQQLGELTKTQEITTEVLRRHFEEPDEKLNSLLEAYKGCVLEAIYPFCDVHLVRMNEEFKKNRRQLALEDVDLFLFLNTNWSSGQ
ncbi:hypothetical protein Ciccas_004994 [Cichlidogyrus casuarinus]|uniref:Uncharacterized protein n=1 Tax=Cichlidogyrus casuarinus TaxID=1844966 RepID=A0ABD2QAC3_9PLAT